MKVYSQERDDPKLVCQCPPSSHVIMVPNQVDHVEDELKCVEKFRSLEDKSIGQCSPELSAFIYSIVTKCLSRHSKRPSSLEVGDIVV